MKRFAILRRSRIELLTACCLTLLFSVPAFCEVQKRSRTGALKVVQLPAPSLSGTVSLEEVINARRSVRQFADRPLNFIQIGQLAWAGQGITDKEHGRRSAPSAWAAYPIGLYFVTPEGLFVYQPDGHSLEQVASTDLRNQLSSAVGQETLAEAACDIVIAGSVRKLAPKSGNKAEKFMLLEAGHVAENIQLQAVALKLATLPVGAFEPKNVSRVCGLPGGLEPLLIVAVGYPRQSKTGAESGAAEKKKVLLVVPSVNFRDEELFETQRVFNEAGIASVIASSKIGPLQGMLGGLAASEVVLDKVGVEDFEAVVFIGGSGVTEFFADEVVLDIARKAAAERKVIAAISTAPTILANAGVLKGVRSTGFITQREAMRKAGAKYTGAAVERDGLVITASDPSAALPFAQTIVSALEKKQQKPVKKPR